MRSALTMDPRNSKTNLTSLKIHALAPGKKKRVRLDLGDDNPLSIDEDEAKAKEGSGQY
jgi:hypothetical protein